MGITPALECFEPRYFETRDGVRLRAGVWSAAEDTPSRGVCLVLQGQSEFLEKYAEVFDALRSRGFTVAAFDWRGQGGSARALADTRKAHICDFAQYAEDLRAFMDVIVRHLDGAPPFALAHSMGGHILLRNLHDHPGIIAAAAITAPMLRVYTRNYPAWLVPKITQLMISLGRGDDFVWGAEKNDPLSLTFADNLVTSDEANFARTKARIEANPALRLAGPTWRWLSAAMASMAITDGEGYAEAIRAPVMMAAAGRDQIVQTGVVRDFSARMPNCFYGEIADAQHEILMENDAIRAKFWNAFDAFTGKVLPKIRA